MISRIRQNKLFKLLAMRMVFVFLVNTIFSGVSYADIFSSNTLAANVEIHGPEEGEVATHFIVTTIESMKRKGASNDAIIAVLNRYLATFDEEATVTLEGERFKVTLENRAFYVDYDERKKIAQIATGEEDYDHAAHDIAQDAQIANAEHSDIDEQGHGLVEDIAAELDHVSSGLGARVSNLLTQTNPHGRTLIGYVEGIEGFDGHAGKQGIHIDVKYMDPNYRNSEGRGLKKILRHEILSYIFPHKHGKIKEIESDLRAHADEIQVAQIKEVPDRTDEDARDWAEDSKGEKKKISRRDFLTAGKGTTAARRQSRSSSEDTKDEDKTPSRRNIYATAKAQGKRGETYNRRIFLEDLSIALGSLSVFSAASAALFADIGRTRMRRYDAMPVPEGSVPLMTYPIAGEDIKNLTARQTSEGAMEHIKIEGVGAGKFNLVLDVNPVDAETANIKLDGMRRHNIIISCYFDIDNMRKLIVGGEDCSHGLSYMRSTEEMIEFIIGVDALHAVKNPEEPGFRIGTTVYVEPENPDKPFKFNANDIKLKILTLFESREGNMMVGLRRGSIIGALMGLFMGAQLIMGRAYERMHAKSPPGKPKMAVDAGKTKKNKKKEQKRKGISDVSETFPHRGVIHNAANIMTFGTLIGVNNVFIHSMLAAPSVNALASWAVGLPPAVGIGVYIVSAIGALGLVFPLLALTMFSLMEPIGCLPWAKWAGVGKKDIKKIVDRNFEKLKKVAADRGDNLLQHALAQVEGFDIYSREGFKLVQEGGKEKNRILLTEDMAISGTALKYLIVRRSIGLVYDKEIERLKLQADSQKEIQAIDALNFGFWLIYSDYELIKRLRHYPLLAPYLFVTAAYTASFFLCVLPFATVKNGIRATFKGLGHLVHHFLIGGKKESVIARGEKAKAKPPAPKRTGQIHDGYTPGQITAFEKEIAWPNDEAKLENLRRKHANFDGVMQHARTKGSEIEVLLSQPENRKILEETLDREEIDIVLSALRNPQESFGWLETKVEGKNKYFLGAQNALAVDLVRFLIRKEAELRKEATSRGETVQPKLLLEYILHEALEKTGLDHRQVITLTTKLLYPEDESLIARLREHEDSDREGVRRQTQLGEVLREFIDIKAGAREGELSLSKTGEDDIELLLLQEPEGLGPVPHIRGRPVLAGESTKRGKEALALAAAGAVVIAAKRGKPKKPTQAPEGSRGEEASGSGVISRRTFNITAALGILGLGLAAKSAQGAEELEKLSADNPELASIIKYIRKHQRQILLNNGLDIWPEYSQVITDFDTMLLRKEFIHPRGLERSRVESEEGLALAKAQQAVLGILADYLVAPEDGKEEMWARLTDVIDEYFGCEQAYRAKIVDIEKGQDKDDERIYIKGYATKDQLDSWKDQRLVQSTKLDQVKELRVIYRELAKLDTGLPLFHIIPPDSEIRGIWEALPPIVNPKPLTSEERKSAAGRIKERIKRALMMEIEPMRAEVRMGERHLRWSEKMHRRGYMSNFAFSEEKREQSAREKKVAGREKVLHTQMEKIDNMELADILELPILEQLSASVESAVKKKNVTEETLKWATRFYRKTGIKPEKDLAEFNDKAARIQLKGNEVLQELAEHYRAMGLAVSFPETADPSRGLLDFQQFVTPSPIPIDKPLTEEELKEHTDRIRELEEAYMDGSIEFKGMVAQRRRIHAEWMLNTYLAKIGPLDRSVRAQNAHEIKKRYQRTELHLADIENLEADMLRAEQALLRLEEKTPAYLRARGEYEALVMRVLRERLAYTGELISIHKDRVVPPSMQEHNKARIEELKNKHTRLTSQIDWYRMIKEFGEVQGIDLPLPSPYFAASGITAIERLRKAAKGTVKRAKVHGYVKEIGPDGKEHLVGVFEPGSIPLGLVVYDDSCNGRLGENIIHRSLEVGRGYEAIGQNIRVACDLGGFFEGTDPNSIGLAYPESAGVQLVRQMASGEYHVDAIEGFYTIDPKGILLGRDPKEKPGEKKYLYAHTFYKMEEVILRLRDGRKVTRYQLVPKRVIVRSTEDKWGKKFDPTDSTREEKPVMGESIEIAEGVPILIDTKAGKVPIKVKKDSRYPERRARIERGPAQAEEDMKASAQLNRMLDDLRLGYPFLDFEDIKKLAETHPHIALGVAQDVRGALSLVDDEIMRSLYKDSVALLDGIRAFDPQVNGWVYVAKVKVTRGGQFIHVNVVPAKGSFVCIPGLATNIRAAKRTLDMEMSAKLKTRIKESFYKYAALMDEEYLQEDFPSLGVRGLDTFDHESAYRVQRAVMRGIYTIDAIDSGLISKRTIGLQNNISIFRNEKTGDIFISTPGRKEPFKIGAVPDLERRIQGEVISAYLKFGLLTESEQKIWKDLCLSGKGNPEQQFDRALQIYLGLKEIEKGESERYARQQDYITSLAQEGLNGIKKREGLARAQRVEKEMQAIAAGTILVAQFIATEIINQSMMRRIRKQAREQSDLAKDTEETVEREDLSTLWDEDMPLENVVSNPLFEKLEILERIGDKGYLEAVRQCLGQHPGATIGDVLEGRYGDDVREALHQLDDEFIWYAHNVKRNTERLSKDDIRVKRAIEFFEVILGRADITDEIKRLIRTRIKGIKGRGKISLIKAEKGTPIRGHASAEYGINIVEEGNIQKETGALVHEIGVMLGLPHELNDRLEAAYLGEPGFDLSALQLALESGVVAKGRRALMIDTADIERIDVAAEGKPTRRAFLKKAIGAAAGGALLATIPGDNATPPQTQPSTPPQRDSYPMPKPFRHGPIPSVETYLKTTADLSTRSWEGEGYANWVNVFPTDKLHNVYPHMKDRNGSVVATSFQHNFSFSVLNESVDRPSERPLAYVFYDINPWVTEVMVPFMGYVAARSRTRQEFLSNLLGVALTKDDVQRLLEPKRAEDTLLEDYLLTTLKEILHRVPVSHRKTWYEKHVLGVLDREIIPALQRVGRIKTADDVKKAAHNFPMEMFGYFLDPEFITAALDDDFITPTGAVSTRWSRKNPFISFLADHAQASWRGHDWSTWLSSEENYRKFRQQWMQNRFVGVTADFTDPASVEKVGDFLRTEGYAEVSDVYCSNIADWVGILASRKMYHALSRLPLRNDASVIVSYSPDVIADALPLRNVTRFYDYVDPGDNLVVGQMFNINGRIEASFYKGLLACLSNHYWSSPSFHVMVAARSQSAKIDTPQTPSSLDTEFARKEYFAYETLIKKIEEAEDELKTLNPDQFVEWVKGWAQNNRVNLDTKTDYFRAVVWNLVNAGIIQPWPDEGVVSKEKTIAQVVTECIEDLKSQHPHRRRTAAVKVSQIGPQAKEAVPALVKVIEDKVEESLFTRMAAVRALGDIGTAARETIPVLAQVLRGASGDRHDLRYELTERLVASTAAEALGKLSTSDPRAKTILMEIVKDAPSDIAFQETLKVLSELNAPLAENEVAIYVKALHRNVWWIRQYAINALGRADVETKERVIPILKEIVKNDGKMFYYHFSISNVGEAAEVLGNLGPQTENEADEILNLLNRAYKYIILFKDEESIVKKIQEAIEKVKEAKKRIRTQPSRAETTDKNLLELAKSMAAVPIAASLMPRRITKADATSTYSNDARITLDILNERHIKAESRSYKIAINKDTTSKEQRAALRKQAKAITEKRGIKIDIVEESKGTDAPTYEFECSKNGSPVGKTTVNLQAHNSALDRTLAVLNLGLASSTVPKNLKNRKPYEQLIGYINAQYKLLNVEGGEFIAVDDTIDEIKQKLHQNPINIILPPAERMDFQKDLEFELQQQALEKFA